MTARPRVLFRQDLGHLVGPGLGDNAVRAIAVRHIADVCNLDAHVVVGCKASLVPIWRRIVGDSAISTHINAAPECYRAAKVVQPSRPSRWTIWNVPNVLTGLLLESGYDDATRIPIDPPNVFPCNPRARTVTICPNENTRGNRENDSAYWSRVCWLFRMYGYRIHLCGSRDHGPLRDFYRREQFDAVFPPTLDALAASVSQSSLAIAGSTGPAWALLASDVQFIAIEPAPMNPPLWHFHRCRPALARPWHIAAAQNLIEFEAVLGRCEAMLDG